MRKNKSAIKRARKSKQRRARNASLKSRMKTEIKRVLEALGREEFSKVDELFRNAVRQICKTKAKGAIHKKKAARKISRLAKRIHQAVVGS